VKFSIFLITGNENKYREIKILLSKFKIEIEKLDLDIPEIQSNEIEEIISDFIKKAYEEVRKPVIAEDSGLFIRKLNGFPGPYTSYVYKTLGNEGVIKLMRDIEDRYAEFKCALAYKDDKYEKVFIGISKGKISNEIRGKGWGFDPIFIPEEASLTFGEMNVEEKNNYSHRGRAINLFIEWFRKTYMID